jgi:hypothetical protein
VSELLATANQMGALRRMLEKLPHVESFASHRYTGQDHADRIWREIEQAGGMSKLTKAQASQYIGQVAELLDDAEE